MDNLAEGAAWVQLVEPKDINGAAVTSSYYDVAPYSRAAIVVSTGVLNAGASDVTIGLSQATDVSGTGAKKLSISRGFICSANGNAVLSGVVDGEMPVGPGMDNKIFVFDVDDNDFDNGFSNIAVTLTDPSASWICAAELVGYNSGTPIGMATIGVDFGK